MTSTIPSRMAAVQLVGHGGLDKLHYRDDVSTPVPRAGEVLIEVAAAGVNNTDVNTRIGWYSKAVGDATGTGGADGFDTVDDADASWMGVPLDFPRSRAPIAVAGSWPWAKAWTGTASASA